ncbi:MAG: PadR family transcriptional regulator [Ignavibacteria bacterium]|jgi:DNA-binding PadR family transcriptional regulator
MLSKLSALILGVISEKELNPYEITKMLKNLETTNWFPIADSTVYATIKNLSKSGFVEGRKEKSGNLPVKTFYKLTIEGKEKLKETLEEYLAKPKDEISKIDVALLLNKNLTKDKIISLLKKKLADLESSLFRLKKQILSYEIDGKRPLAGLMLLKHQLHISEAEIKTLKELNRQLNIQKYRSTKSAFDLRMN